MPALTDQESASLGLTAMSQQRQRSSTPTALPASTFGDNTSLYKSAIEQPSEQQLDAYAAAFSSTSRQDLIERLKRSQSPAWQRSGAISPFQKSPTSKDGSSPASLLPAINLKQSPKNPDHDSRDTTDAFLDNGSPESPLARITDAGSRSKLNQFAQGFHQDPDSVEQDDLLSRTIPDSTSWYKPMPSPSPRFGPISPSIDIPGTNRTPLRSRAPSLQSSLSSFLYRQPTSPLAYQANNEELDLSPIDLAASPTKPNRRHTLPPHQFQAFRQSLTPMTLAQAARQPPSLQRENSLPVYSHQMRRSYTGLPFPTSPSPSTPSFLRSRRSSFASDASPMQASMIGSYEESILRGRMSTTPSRPLDFTASIGALGRGDCKPKYPAHVSVEFPAVYYSWHTSNGGSISDEPAPYVGLVDLEHKLNAPAQKERAKKRRDTLPDQNSLNDSSVKSREAKRQEKRRKRSQSPANALQSFGGCYRIPQQGQLQILIKNPHKTAVKLFLVPYDLENMQPGTKTFVRQRSYSTGPVIEKPLTSRSFSDSIIEAKQKTIADKPILRYLIQLNICCPAKGRFYLYKSINVVFANRIPDDKQKLQTETLWPEPKYSPWKPSTTESGASTPSRRQSMDWDSKRRSYTGTHLDGPAMDTMDDIPVYSGRKPAESFDTRIPQRQSIQSSLPMRDINPDLYTKLNRGELGYGGRPATPESGESLLAQRLKGHSDGSHDGHDEEDILGAEAMILE